MPTRLISCPSCDRHVRATESACPFCDAPMIAVAEPARRAAPGLTRAAILFASAAAVAACGPGGDSAADASDVTAAPEVVALYGPAPVDVRPEDAAEDTNAPDIVAMYGPAPVDAGADVQSGRDGEPAVLYGPVPVDSGNNG